MRRPVRRGRRTSRAGNPSGVPRLSHNPRGLFRSSRASAPRAPPPQQQRAEHRRARARHARRGEEEPQVRAVARRRDGQRVLLLARVFKGGRGHGIVRNRAGSAGGGEQDFHYYPEAEPDYVHGYVGSVFGFGVFGLMGLIILLVILACLTDRAPLLDVALVYALLYLLAVEVMARAFLVRRSRRKRKGEEARHD